MRGAFLALPLLLLSLAKAEPLPSSPKAIIVVGDLNNDKASRAELDLRDSLDFLIKEGRFSECPATTVVYSGYNFAVPGDARLLGTLGVSRSGLPRLLYVELNGRNPGKVLWNRTVTDLKVDLQGLLQQLGLQSELDQRFEGVNVFAANGNLSLKLPGGFKLRKSVSNLPYMGKTPPQRIFGGQNDWPIVTITYLDRPTRMAELRTPLQEELTDSSRPDLDIWRSAIDSYNGIQWLSLSAVAGDITLETLVTPIQGKAVMVTLYSRTPNELAEVALIRDSLRVEKQSQVSGGKSTPEETIVKSSSRTAVNEQISATTDPLPKAPVMQSRAGLGFLITYDSSEERSRKMLWSIKQELARLNKGGEFKALGIRPQVAYYDVANEKMRQQVVKLKLIGSMKERFLLDYIALARFDAGGLPVGIVRSTLMNENVRVTMTYMYEYFGREWPRE